MSATGEDDAELGSFFAEIEEIQTEIVAPQEEEAKATSIIGPSIPASARIERNDENSAASTSYSHPVSVVYSKAPELREEVQEKESHPVYTYDLPEYQHLQPEKDEYSRYYFDESKASKYNSSSNYRSINGAMQPPPPPLPPATVIPKSDKTFVRKAADEVWVDETLQEWPENDFRIFVGDIGKEVTTEMLTRQFQQYKSFAMAKVVRGKDGKTKGYGFVSFLEPGDCIKAMKEQNGKYLSSRPMKIRRSTWKDRDIEEVREKEQKKRKFNATFGLA